jgi:hypothetical protein
VRLEASTKPHIYNLIHEFLVNMAFTMACPNFKKGLKMAFGPLGIKLKTSFVEHWASVIITTLDSISLLSTITIESSSTTNFQILPALIYTFLQLIDLSTHIPFYPHNSFFHWSLVIIIVILKFCEKVCDNIKSDRNINKWILNWGGQFQDFNP